MIKYILLFLVIIWVINVIFYTIAFNQKSNRLYCFIFEHKDWKLWNKICKHLKEAEFLGYQKNEDGTTMYIEFMLIINDINYFIIYWYENNRVSVHRNNKYILSYFDEYHSNKAAKIINEYLL